MSSTPRFKRCRPARPIELTCIAPPLAGFAPKALAQDVDLGNLGTRGFRIDGIDIFDASGVSVSSAGPTPDRQSARKGAFELPMLVAACSAQRRHLRWLSEVFSVLVSWRSNIARYVCSRTQCGPTDFVDGGSMRKRSSLRAMSISGLLVLVLGGAVGVASAQSDCNEGQTSAAFGFTGAAQTFTVPAGVTSAVVIVKGAQGSAGAGAGAGLGGRGALVVGTLAVTPLSTLNVFVGGAASAGVNGFNGGASGGDPTAGRGGGASDIRVGGVAEANRVVTAGGGGGGGNIGCFGDSVFGGGGGAGGGGAGVQGTNSAAGGGGFGGTAGAGGSNGIGCAGFQGQSGLSATTGTGGAGGLGTRLCTSQPTSGGGGGGGFLGGGGGGAGAAGTVGCRQNDTGGGGGGGGGTSNAATLTSVAMIQGVNSGNGAVEICYVLPPFVFGDGFE